MDLMNIHLWPKSIAEAGRIQQTLKQRVNIVPLKKALRYVAAADAAFDDRNVYAAATLFECGGLLHMQDTFSGERIRFDYMPGLLAFREGRVIINALRKLTFVPDLVLLDGQGIAHPEGFGIASHIGVILDIPTIGCAKSRLVGEYEEPKPVKGDWTYLYYHGTRVGAVVRTRSNVRPVFVSPGHLSDIESSVEIVLRCTSGYRIPEPLRRADRLSKMMKRNACPINNPIV
jgi:deoxyribonuclease V